MTTKILIVRTSSLGDLVHMLPAISDIAQHVPGAQIDCIHSRVASCGQSSAASRASPLASRLVV